ncbi:hypothetical protein [uncultured Oxalicibacterium sp.]|uniref:hypothetical protein n=1 Tax=uncultured Oxalicibacterium sp. TaxID=1168540 RepID=UPI0025E81E5B|nr:hypothetical protein [uncultured Oxalicibacterium sp.]
MLIKDLQLELEKLGVPRRVYSIGRPADERLCIEQRGGRWDVYFIERGKETTLRVFPSESDAALFMLSELRKEI